MKLNYIVPFFCLLILNACQDQEARIIWQKSMPTIGSQSSPLASDLNNDGVLDIIMGAGANEFEESEQGVLAFDGSNGEILWQSSCVDQVFGSPTFNDINSDKISDVIIGGRSSQLFAINGLNGEKIWQYDPQDYSTHPILKYANKNFYNSVLLPDCNGDGIEDILISNGGNPEVFEFVKEGREVGVILVLDSKTGAVIAADTVPDSNETYMTPIYVEQNDGSKSIAFGTGGETFSGNLYIAELEDLLNNDLSKARLIASEDRHGFIAPPAFVDLTKDNVLDLVAISHAGTMTAFDGSNYQKLWQFKIPNTESSNGLAIGNFTDDEVPDIFTFVSKGKWPWNSGSYQFMLNGLNGELEYIDSLACPRVSSPVVYDLNNDQVDEVVFSLDSFDCQGFTGPPPARMISKLVAIDFSENEIFTLDEKENYKNVFTTPLLADINGDGYLDITHAYYPHQEDLGILIFEGMLVQRMGTPYEVVDPVKWGAYMGSNGNGVFR